MSLPLIIGTSAAAGGVLLGLLFFNRKTIRRSTFPTSYERRARSEIRDINQQHKIGRSIMRQHSDEHSVRSDAFNSDSPKSDHLRDSILGKDNVARGRRGKGHKTKRRTRRHR